MWLVLHVIEASFVKKGRSVSAIAELLLQRRWKEQDQSVVLDGIWVVTAAASDDDRTVAVSCSYTPAIHKVGVSQVLQRQHKNGTYSRRIDPPPSASTIRRRLS